MNILPEDNTWFKSLWKKRGLTVSALDEITLSEMNDDDYILISDMDGGKDGLPSSKKIKVATLLEYVRRNNK